MLINVRASAPPSMVAAAVAIGVASAISSGSLTSSGVCLSWDLMAETASRIAIGSSVNCRPVPVLGQDMFALTSGNWATESNAVATST